MKQKPTLSFWQIWNLSFGFLGIQIGYSLQSSQTSRILSALGADLSHLSYYWLAAPIAGLIVQPIIGMSSDRTWGGRFGRRIPFILGGGYCFGLSDVLYAEFRICCSYYAAGYIRCIYVVVHGLCFQCFHATFQVSGRRYGE